MSDEDIALVYDEAQSAMDKSVKSLRSELQKVRTGRASTALLDGVQVEYYGAMTPMNQLSNMSTPDPRLIVIAPFDQSVIPEIEKAIMKSDLGLNPATAGEVIRIPMPPLTEETRKGYIKQARSEAESARVSVRNARRDAMGMLKELVKDKEISEDDERRGQDQVQKITDGFIARIEEMLGAKESDLLEI